MSVKHAANGGSGKKEFIQKCLVIFQRVLEKELPDEILSEGEMIEKAYSIIYQKIRHIATGL